MAKKNYGQNYSCSMSVGASLLTLKVPKLAEIGYIFFKFQIRFSVKFFCLFLWTFNCKKIKKLLPYSKIQNGAQIQDGRFPQEGRFCSVFRSYFFPFSLSRVVVEIKND
jgi:hypothetical protein